MRRDVITKTLALLTALLVTSSILGQGLSKNIRYLTIEQDTFICAKMTKPAATIDYWAWKGVFSEETISKADSLIENLESQVGLSLESVRQLSDLSESLRSQLVAAQHETEILKQGKTVLERELDLTKQNLTREKAEVKVWKAETRKQKTNKWLWGIGGACAGIVAGIIIAN